MIYELKNFPLNLKNLEAIRENNLELTYINVCLIKMIEYSFVIRNDELNSYQNFQLKGNKFQNKKLQQSN